MKEKLRALLPPLILVLLLLLSQFSPKQGELLESAISPQLEQNIKGWRVQKIQESQKEREALAADTVFSKAIYHPTAKDKPAITVSIVYSGNDMNASIHRPERCLPAQGHLSLQSSWEDISLNNGKAITFACLQSTTFPEDLKGEKLHHLTYYVFVGHDSIQSSHLARTFCDIQARFFTAKVQRWAYVQLSSYWGKSIKISEKCCKTGLEELTSQLIPLLINWQKIEQRKNE